MKTKPQHLQEPFLNALCRERVPVSLYLGIEQQDQIKSFGPSVVLLKNALTQMVCKHANLTVVPARAVSISSAAEATLQ